MHTIKRVVFICIFIAMLFWCEVNGKKSRQKKIKPGKPPETLDVTKKTAAVRLRCKKKGLISTIDIISYKTYTLANGSASVCSGLQSDLLTESTECYWKRRCVLQFSDFHPIVQTCCLECLGQKPDKLVISYKCFDKDKVSFLSDNGSITSDGGMIVSHMFFPWLYKTDVKLTMTLKSKTSKKSRLYVMAQHLQLASNDEVFIRDNNSKKIGITNANVTYIIHAPTLSDRAFVRLTFDATETNGDQGFKLCYYWASETNTVDTKDICNLAMSKSGKSRSGKGSRKGRKRGRSGKRRSKSKKTLEEEQSVNEMIS